MSVSEDGYFVCDICGDDTGRFNQETGNHPQCESLAALRARVERLERIESVAKTVNAWMVGFLGESDLQRELAAALAPAAPE
jgi:hypothetical protein